MQLQLSSASAMSSAVACNFRVHSASAPVAESIAVLSQCSALPFENSMMHPLCCSLDACEHACMSCVISGCGGAPSSYKQQDMGAFTFVQTQEQKTPQS